MKRILFPYSTPSVLTSGFWSSSVWRRLTRLSMVCRSSTLCSFWKKWNTFLAKTGPTSLMVWYFSKSQLCKSSTCSTSAANSLEAFSVRGGGQRSGCATGGGWGFVWLFQCPPADWQRIFRQNHPVLRRLRSRFGKCRRWSAASRVCKSAQCCSRRWRSMSIACLEVWWIMRCTTWASQLAFSQRQMASSAGLTSSEWQTGQFLVFQGVPSHRAIRRDFLRHKGSRPWCVSTNT